MLYSRPSLILLDLVRIFGIFDTTPLSFADFPHQSMREVPPSVHIFFFSVIISVIIFIITKVPECHPSLIKSEAQGSRTQNQSLLEDNQMALYRRQGSRPFPWKRNAKKSKMAVWGGLTNSCEKKRSKKQRRKGKIQTSECRVPKNNKEIRKPSSAINAKK